MKPFDTDDIYDLENLREDLASAYRQAGKMGLPAVADHLDDALRTLDEILEPLSAKLDEEETWELVQMNRDYERAVA